MSERAVQRQLLHRFIEKTIGNSTPAVWKVEWKRRQTGSASGEFRPHMHMLYFRLRGMCTEQVLGEWQRILNSPLTTEVLLQEMDTTKMAAIYAAKYCGKDDELTSLDNVPYHNKVGRHVGWLRKKLIPWCTESVYENLPDDLVAFIRQRAGEMLEWYDTAKDGGVSFLGELAEEIRKDLGQFGIDDGSELDYT